MTLRFEQHGSWASFEAYLKRQQSDAVFAVLHRFGPMGVNALRAATPVDSSETANSWTYEAKKTPKGFSIHWRNTNMVDGIPIVVMLQYGHGTGTGGYVQGRDFINPAIKPVIDQMVAAFMKEVTR